MSVQRAPAKRLLIVEPDGRLRKAPAEAQLRVHAELLRKPETLGEMGQRNGLSGDQETVGMLKRLNPGYDFSKEVVPSGTKLVMFVPHVGANQAPVAGSSNRLTFDTPLVAKWAVRKASEPRGWQFDPSQKTSAKGFRRYFSAVGSPPSASCRRCELKLLRGPCAYR